MNRIIVRRLKKKWTSFWFYFDLVLLFFSVYSEFRIKFFRLYPTKGEKGNKEYRFFDGKTKRNNLLFTYEDRKDKRNVINESLNRYHPLMLDRVNWLRVLTKIVPTSSPGEEDFGDRPFCFLPLPVRRPWILTLSQKWSFTRTPVSTRK